MSDDVMVRIGELLRLVTLRVGFIGASIGMIHCAKRRYEIGTSYIATACWLYLMLLVL